MIVALVCDGFDKLAPEFKEFAYEKQFFDQEILRHNDFLKKNRDGNWNMKEMGELILEGREEDLPPNILHCFQVRTWDFDLEDEVPRDRRINFVFALKQRNDGKINSHKWFY